MKRIEIITRPYKLEEVKDALSHAGVTGMTVMEVKGCGRQGGHKEVYRGAEYQVTLLPKVLLMVVVEDHKVANVVAAVQAAARTGEVGDGKIFVLPVEEVIRIRTGETGQAAV